MSNPNGYRDHTLSRIYREGAWPEPSRQIDQAIVAAARRAAREQHSFARRWAPPFAVAATVLLTSALVLKVVREQPEAVATSAPESAPRAKAFAPEPKAAETKPAPPPPQSVPAPQGFSSTMDAGEAERLERARRDLGLRDLQSTGSPPAANKAAPAPRAAPATKKESAEPARAADSVQRRADPPQIPQAAAPISVFGATPPSAPAPAQPARAVAKPAQPFTQNAIPAAPRAEAAAAPPAAQVPSPQMSIPAEAAVAGSTLGGVTLAPPAAKAAERSPQSWIEDIRKLLKEGKSEEAGAEIARFKKRYPDYVLPEDLR
jgi:hypothetical protein